jgi:hypothetical protein
MCGKQPTKQTMQRVVCSSGINRWHGVTKLKAASVAA